MGKQYYLGLDLGTGSLGWAVTDKEYHIVRAHGKALWGVRLFDSAMTAQERRTFRTGRRRLKRRNWRCELLQQLFAEEIAGVDPGFYQRMKESRYVPEDKHDADGRCPELPYALFVEKNYTDKDYHRQFPTIYHLRKWLMETDEMPDIRLVYLALHHIIKHRGHFLFSGDIADIKDFKQNFLQFKETIDHAELDFGLDLSDEALNLIERTLKDKTKTRSAKKISLIKGLEAHTPCEKAILTLLSGGTVSLSAIFSDESLDECERPKICFSDSRYEEVAGVIEAALGERYIVIEHAKAIYDWAVLADVLGEYSSLSEAKVASYEKHKKDLIYLKRLVKENLSREEYQRIFVVTDEKLANYPAYINMTKVNGKKKDIAGTRCTQEEFYKFLKQSVISTIKDEEKIKYLAEEMERGSFLPRQVTKDNGVLPYQIHQYELNRIIDNLQDRIPMLKENADKIHQIFVFRIPYYVGPLNGIKAGDGTTNWVVRKADGKIYPWNFSEKVDTDASAEQFIRRMTNKCTYLPLEEVLPKNSMLYSKFMVLNELNNVRINGELLTVELKQKIYEELFQKQRKVTVKKLRDYLVREGITGREADITGVDKDFKGSLTAYHDFKEKLTGVVIEEEKKEEIILNITLFGDDTKLLKKRLSVLCPSLTPSQIKALSSLSYKGWGRLSKAFLSGITAPAPETGEIWTIIRALWETQDNLMQLLSEKYRFAEAVEASSSMDKETGFSYKAVDDLAVSPAVKRQIWQTLQVVKEVCSVMGNPPERVFVEMAREKENSAPRDSRRRKLIDLYKKCRQEERDWVKELEGLTDQQLRSDKLFLYYTQKGRCMYTGHVIRLEDLMRDNQTYDIDHIYPQSKVMDDSLDNRVLVERVSNADKSDSYPLDSKIREDMASFWKMLLAEKLISPEKYKRLTRANAFEDSELAGFIARQLVETRQGTKAVAALLKQILPDTEIVYAKANAASRFRQDFGLMKVREMNDLHHAKDAYVNIVVGNAYFTKFTKNAVWYVKNHPGRSYNLKKMFTSGQDIVSGGEVAWRAGESGTIRTVKQVMNKNNILVTRRSYQQKGALFDQQPMKKGKGQVPLKGSDERLQDIEKYGGYNKATGTYFMLVESVDKRGNKIRTIEYVPLYLARKVECGEVIQYLEKERNLIRPEVRLSPIKIDTLFKVDGFYMWLSGRTGDQLLFKNAIQLLLPAQETMTLKKVLKFTARRKENQNLTLIPADGISSEDLIRLYETFYSKVKDSIYRVRLSAQEKTLREKKENFMRLPDEDKCLVLSEILHLFQCQSGAADLRMLGGSKSAGILKLNNNITKYEQISILNQSITGIYEREVNLKTV